MAGRLRLGKSQWADLEIVRDLSVEPIDRLIARLEAADPPPLTRADLERIFRETLLEAEIARALLRNAFGIANLIDRLELPIQTVVEDLRSSLPSTWSESDKNRWVLVEPAFRRLLDSSIIRRVVRSESLSHDYANILQSSRVITDLRPIFTGDGKEIEGAIVSFTLRVGYFNGEVMRSISLALDCKDVEKLEQQCSRARTKAEALERRFSQASKGTSIRVVGQGES
jgi:hypothetical protein